MVTKDPAGSSHNFEVICDWGMVCSLSAMIFVLPASIALLDSFAGLTIFIYFVKNIYRMAIDGPSKTAHLTPPGKARFIWEGFAPPENVLNLPLRFLVLSVFISVVFSHYPGQSFYAFIGKFLKCIFLYFCVIEALNDKKRAWVFLDALLLSAFIAALSGTVQHFTGKDFLKGHLIGTENFVSTHRINSSFFGANGFGAYLLPVIGLVTHILYTALFRNRSWIIGGGLVIFLSLLLACLCWTYSRSAWIGYLFMLFFMVWIDRRKALIAGVLFLVCIFIFLPSLNQARNLNLMNDNSSGVPVKNESILNSIRPDLGDIGSGRVNYWKKAVSIIRLSPVWGTGPNTYTKILKLQDPDPGTWRYAHNCYLQMMAETGLVGLVCFMWLLFVLFHHGLDYCRQITDPWPLAFLQGALTGLSGFLVQSFFDNTFYTVQLGVLMWLVIGFTVAVTRIGK